ncbi:MAG: lipid II flippase MurJ, partial [Candidatus Binatia bacterium]
EPLVRILYQRGAFDETSVHLTSQALACYALGFPAVAVSRAFNRMFIGLKDTWTPTKTTLLRIGIKILLAWILIYPFSHVGLALAESISNIIRALLMFFLLPDRVKGQESWNMVRAFGRILVGSLVMGAVVYFAGERMDGLFNLPVELAASILLGVASYGMIAFLFRWEESQFVLKTLFGSKTLSTHS